MSSDYGQLINQSCSDAAGLVDFSVRIINWLESHLLPCDAGTAFWLPFINTSRCTWEVNVLYTSNLKQIINDTHFTHIYIALFCKCSTSVAYGHACTIEIYIIVKRKKTRNITAIRTSLKNCATCSLDSCPGFGPGWLGGTVNNSGIGILFYWFIIKNGNSIKYIGISLLFVLCMQFMLIRALMLIMWLMRDVLTRTRICTHTSLKSSASRNWNDWNMQRKLKDRAFGNILT